MAAPATTPPTSVLQPAPTVPSLVSPLVGELEAAVASCLEPAAFFVSWQVRKENLLGTQRSAWCLAAREAVALITLRSARLLTSPPSPVATQGVLTLAYT